MIMMGVFCAIDTAAAHAKRLGRGSSSLGGELTADGAVRSAEAGRATRGNGDEGGATRGNGDEGGATRGNGDEDGAARGDADEGKWDRRDSHAASSVQAKEQRHAVFAHWLVETYGKVRGMRWGGVGRGGWGGGSVATANHGRRLPPTTASTMRPCRHRQYHRRRRVSPGHCSRVPANPPPNHFQPTSTHPTHDPRTSYPMDRGCWMLAAGRAGYVPLSAGSVYPLCC